MTKHLRYLFATLLVWVCTVGGYAETKSVVCTLGKNAASCTSTGDCSVTWTYGSAPTTTTSPNNGMYWAIKANQEVVLTASLSAKSVTITSIKIQAYTNSGAGKTIEVYIGDTKFGETATLTNKSAEYTFDGSATGDVLLHLKSSSSTKSHIVKTVTINYEESGSSTTKTATNLSFGADKDGSTVALTKGLLSDGSEFTGYTATEANSVAGTITYAATGDNVATVDATSGAVTVNKTTYGKTIITATFTPTDATTYESSSATYTVVNSEPAKTATSLSFGADKDGSTVALTEGLLSDGSEFTGYTATESTGAAGTIAYAATGDNVATVDATSGAVTVNKTTYGTTTITATFTPTNADAYATSTATYTITNEKKVDESTIVFDCTSYNTNIVGSYSSNTGTARQFPSVAGKEYKFTLKTCMYNSNSVQMKKGEGVIKSPVFTSFPNGYKVVVTYTTAGVPTLTSDEMTSLECVTNTSAKTVTLEVPSSSATFTITASSDNATNVSRIEISSLKDSPNLKFAEATQTKQIEVGGSIVDMQQASTVEGFGGKITYSLDCDKSVAEISDNTICVYKYGKITVTASTEETENYRAATASYVLDMQALKPELSYSKVSDNVEIKDGSYLASEIFVNPHKLTGIAYASSKEDVATVTADGDLELKAVGETVVTAKFAGNDYYEAGDASFTLSVVDTRAEAPISIKEQTVTVKLPVNYSLSANVNNEQNLALAYASSNDDIVVDEKTGNITSAKVGSANITVSFAGNDTYKPFEVVFALSVEDARTTDADFKFGETSYTIDINDANRAFNALDELQNPHGLTLTWTISPTDDNVLIDENGYVVVDKRGTYTITATGAANDTYAATTATCTLVVTDKTIEELQVVFVPSEDKGTTSSSSAALSKSYVTISSKGAAFGNGTDYRFYGGKTHTISTKAGKIIKIEFEGNDTSNPISNLTYSGTDGEYKSETTKSTWTGSATSVTFATGKQARATKINVTLEMPVAKSFSFSQTASDITLEDYDNANVTIDRTMTGNDGWWTLCLPFALDATQVATYFGDGVKLRTLDSMNGTTMNFKSVTEMEAGKPYLIYPTKDFDGKNTTFECVQLKEKAPESSTDQGYSMLGTYTKATLATDGTDLFLGANNKFYKPAENGNVINGFRVYFQCPADKVGMPMTANIDGVETAITRLDGETFAGAADTRVYNLQGQCVGTTLRGLASGIYVCGGRKVVVK